MRTAKLILGILSLVLFIVIMLQSCAVGVVNSIDDNTSDLSGGGGTLLAFIMLIAGIIGVVARDSRTGSLVAGIFYLVGALIGFVSLGTYGDLVIWSVVSLAFGMVFVISALRMEKARPRAQRNVQRYDQRSRTAPQNARQGTSRSAERRTVQRRETMQRSQRR